MLLVLTLTPVILFTSHLVARPKSECKKALVTKVCYACPVFSGFALARQFGWASLRILPSNSRPSAFLHIPNHLHFPFITRTYKLLFLLGEGTTIANCSTIYFFTTSTSCKKLVRMNFAVSMPFPCLINKTPHETNIQQKPFSALSETLQTCTHRLHIQPSSMAEARSPVQFSCRIFCLWIHKRGQFLQCLSNK